MLRNSVLPGSGNHDHAVTKVTEPERAPAYMFSVQHVPDAVLVSPLCSYVGLFCVFRPSSVFAYCSRDESMVKGPIETSSLVVASVWEFSSVD